MDFTKPIMAEIIHSEEDVNTLREWLKKNDISFKEETEDCYYEADVHIFECRMTREQLCEANGLDLDVLFYQ